LRFLGLVLGGWIAVRALLVAPGWGGDAPVVAAVTVPVAPVAAQPAAPVTAAPFQFAPKRDASGLAAGATAAPLLAFRPVPRQRALVFGTPVATAAPGSIQARAPEVAGAAAAQVAQAGHPIEAFVRPSAPVTLAGIERWSLSSWAFLRDGAAGAQLASGGQLGGSQIGARALYRVSDRLALSARIYSPLRDTGGAEAALGVEVQPVAGLPVRLLAERRQALGPEGRSAFALLAHGGVSDRPVLGPLTLDTYAQAGMVGLRSRDLFADGSVRLGLPVSDRISLGAGAWGAAQPGASRLDLGPQASYRLPQLGRGARISAEYRFRLAGEARPGSGPAVTIATDF
jgi:hypothetical protein